MKIIADPVAWLWLAVLAGALYFLVRRRWRVGWWLLGLALLASAAQLANLPARLLAGLERPYLFEPRETIRASDAVVVLGGYLSPFTNGYLGLELNESVDRLMTGIALVRNGKAHVLVLGGGGGGLPSVPIEAQSAEAWIDSWKLVPAPVEFLGVCIDTHDEALHASRLAQTNGWKRIILVTSAWHLRRAAAAFRKTGLEVVAVGSDFQGTAALQANWPLSLAPCTGSLVLFKTWLEETIGFLYYRLRHWA